jgi:cytochrome P450
MTIPDRSTLRGRRAPTTWQALSYLYRPERFFTAAHRRYGDAFVMRLLGERWVVLAHPNAVREVFGLSPTEATSGEPNHVLRPVIGTRNLLLMDGQEHLHRRRMVLPTLHGESIRRHEATIAHATAREIASWPRGVAFSVQPSVEALIFATTARCVLGVETTARLQAAAKALLQMFDWITSPRCLLVFFLLGPERLMRLPRFRRQLQIIDQAIQAEIDHRRRSSDLHQHLDILSLLIQARDAAGSQLSDDELRDEVVTLLLAGYQNTATTIAWAAHELAHSPDSQERLHAEPHTVDAVIDETLRLHPPVPLVVRRLQRPATIAGRRLPAGTNVCPCAFLVHRRADLYPQPLTFRPERWQGSRPTASEWFPFGGALRRCPGAAFARLETRIALQEISRSIRLVPQRAQRERSRARAIILAPVRGSRLIAQCRA